MNVSNQTDLPQLLQRLYKALKDNHEESQRPFASWKVSAIKLGKPEGSVKNAVAKSKNFEDMRDKFSSITVKDQNNIELFIHKLQPKIEAPEEGPYSYEPSSSQKVEAFFTQSQDGFSGEMLYRRLKFDPNQIDTPVYLFKQLLNNFHNEFLIYYMQTWIGKLDGLLIQFSKLLFAESTREPFIIRLMCKGLERESTSNHDTIVRSMHVTPKQASLMTFDKNNDLHQEKNIIKLLSFNDNNHIPRTTFVLDCEIIADMVDKEQLGKIISLQISASISDAHSKLKESNILGSIYGLYNDTVGEFKHGINHKTLQSLRNLIEKELNESQDVLNILTGKYNPLISQSKNPIKQHKNVNVDFTNKPNAEAIDDFLDNIRKQGIVEEDEIIELKDSINNALTRSGQESGTSD